MSNENNSFQFESVKQVNDLVSKWFAQIKSPPLLIIQFTSPSCIVCKNIENKIENQLKSLKKYFKRF